MIKTSARHTEKAMRTTKRSHLTTKFTGLMLLFSLLTGTLTSSAGTAFAQESQGGGAKSDAGASKISSDLRQQKERRHKDEDLVNVILQLNDKPGGRLNSLLTRNGAHIRAHFESFNFYHVELPTSAIEELAAYPEVNYVSLDRAANSLGHLTATTGADAVRTQTTQTTQTVTSGTGKKKKTSAS